MYDVRSFLAILDGEIRNCDCDQWPPTDPEQCFALPPPNEALVFAFCKYLQSFREGKLISLTEIS
jgi:hypothetical protein